MMKKNKTSNSAGFFDTDVIPAFLTADRMAARGSYFDPSTHEDDFLLYDDDFAYEDALEPSANVSDFVVCERLKNAAQRGYIDFFLQPIVTLPQRHHAFYELYGRLSVNDGVYLDAGKYLHLAEEERVVNELDAEIFTKCLQVLKRQYSAHGMAHPCFINVTPASFRKKIYMSRVLELLSRYRQMASALIFEMPYSAYKTLSPAESKIMSALAMAGVRFSADHLTRIPDDIKFMRAKNISFVKVDGSALAREGRSERGFSNILSAKRNLDVNGITLIAEKIEAEKNLLSLLDFDVRYGQGYLLGKPDFQGVYTQGDRVPAVKA